MKRPETELMFAPGPLLLDAMTRFPSYKEGVDNLRGFLEGSAERGQMTLDEKETDGARIQHLLTTKGSAPNDVMSKGAIAIVYWRGINIDSFKITINEYMTYTVETNLADRSQAKLEVRSHGNIRLTSRLPAILEQGAIGKYVHELIDKHILKNFSQISSFKVRNINHDKGMDYTILELDYREIRDNLYRMGIAYERGRPITGE